MGEKKKRLKKEEEARKKKDEEEDEVEAKVVMTPYRKWEKSLMACTTLGQLFIHLTTLDNSIVWSKSIMNTKCKICRRKQDPDKMLLCDGCDNAYHIYCLKPKLKSIPEGDWFCPECKPKERVRSPRLKVKKRRRKRRKLLQRKSLGEEGRLLRVMMRLRARKSSRRLREATRREAWLTCLAREELPR